MWRTIAALSCSFAVACTGAIGDPGSEPGTAGGSGPGAGGAAGSGVAVEWVDPWEGACEETGSEVAETRLRRLTAAEYAASVRTIVGSTVSVAEVLPEDGHVGPFSGNVLAEPSATDVTAFMEAAELVAADAVARVEALAGCAAADAGCTERVARTVGRLAWRRPLSEEEVSELLAIAELSTDFEERARLVLETLLASPYFLYVVEGPVDPPPGEAVELDPYERATRLSLFLWGSTPDASLLDAAASGALDTREGLAREASRLMADDRFGDALERYHFEWLGLLGTDSVASIHDLQKDTEAHPEWTDELGASMRREVETFVRRVYEPGSGGRLDDLLAGRFSYLEPELAAFYGLAHPDGAGVDRVDYPEGLPRAGLLTQAGVLAVYGKIVQSAPIQRGLLVRERILCLPILPPPPGAMVDDPPNDPSMTRREQFEAHGSAACGATCHETFDPIGFAFEHFDGIGAYREMDGPSPVDATGTIPGADVDRPIDGAVELGRALAESRTVETCFTRQWASFALGREIDDAADGCAMERLRDRLVEEDGDLEAFLIDLAASEVMQVRSVR